MFSGPSCRCDVLHRPLSHLLALLFSPLLSPEFVSLFPLQIFYLSHTLSVSLSLSPSLSYTLSLTLCVCVLTPHTHTHRNTHTHTVSHTYLKQNGCVHTHTHTHTHPSHTVQSLVSHVYSLSYWNTRTHTHTHTHTHTCRCHRGPAGSDVASQAHSSSSW